MLKKTLFLEYKIRDFEDEELKMPQADSVMAAFEKLKGVIKLKPDVIWFDYLMFPGKWTVQKQGTWKQGIHKDCQFCQGVDRGEKIYQFAKELLSQIHSSIKTGFFSMPFAKGEFGGWEQKLGQDVELLGNIFNSISPMLYHRMIDKPTSYIHEHVVYLSQFQLKAKILPIIQLKDMPDDVPDTLDLEEIEKAVDEAIKPSSEGVALFSWDQTIEKGKLEGVSQILRKI
ncbi:MAG: hypothetical protein ACOYT7_02530 [Patescibacteria group bacterium]